MKNAKRINLLNPFWYCLLVPPFRYFLEEKKAEYQKYSSHAKTNPTHQS